MEVEANFESGHLKNGLREDGCAMGSHPHFKSNALNSHRKRYIYYMFLLSSFCNSLLHEMCRIYGYKVFDPPCFILAMRMYILNIELFEL